MSTDAVLNTFQTIAGQIQQLTNIYVVKSISTGDRVLDGTICIILNTILVLLGGFLYKFILEKWNIIINGNKVETDLPTDIVHEKINYQDYKLDDIVKYKFCLNNNLIINDTIEWIKKTYNTYNTNKQFELQYDDISNDVYVNGKNSKIVFMPIWKYKNVDTKKYEYVWLANCILYTNNFNALSDLVKEIKKIKTEKVKISGEIYEILCNSDKNGNEVYTQLLGNINPNRIFKNIYFDEKPKLLSILEKFKEKKMYPEDLSIDNKLGILLHGPPGTGKTGCISAIANYLGRKILLINKLDQQNYKDIFNHITQNPEFIKEHVIVFDEIDYILCSNKEKLNSISIKLNELKEQLLITVDSDERNDLINEIKMLKKNNNEDFIKSILQFLDGMIDMSERIIIATTNYPERINPLFLRPGRFDLKLELGYCSQQMFIDIVQKKYQNFLLDNIDTLSNILLKNITPCVLINLLLQSNNLNELMSSLNELPHSEKFSYK